MTEQDEIKDLNNVKFFVEANSYEQQSLWEHCQAGKNNYKMDIDWVQVMAGYGRVLGQITSGEEKLDVFVSFNFAKINGKLICFYYPSSRGIDHEIINKYIKSFNKKYDNGLRNAMTDAQNFHHCIHALDEL